MEVLSSLSHAFLPVLQAMVQWADKDRDRRFPLICLNTPYSVEVSLSALRVLEINELVTPVENIPHFYSFAPFRKFVERAKQLRDRRELIRKDKSDKNEDSGLPKIV